MMLGIEEASTITGLIVGSFILERTKIMDRSSSIFEKDFFFIKYLVMTAAKSFFQSELDTCARLSNDTSTWFDNSYDLSTTSTHL